jgi:hypothetical protein
MGCLTFAGKCRGASIYFCKCSSCCLMRVSLCCFRRVDQHLVTSLLFRIIQGGKLTVRLARIFIGTFAVWSRPINSTMPSTDCGHEDVSKAMAGLDLFSAMPGARDSRSI